MRFVQVLFSYAIAALAGSFALALISVLVGEATAGHILGSTVVIATFGMIVASFITLPVLLVTEIQKIANWRFYVAVCAIAAPTFFWVLNPRVMEADLLMFPLTGCCGALSGAVYWWFAWRLLEPDLWPSVDQ